MAAPGGAAHLPPKQHSVVSMPQWYHVVSPPNHGHPWRHAITRARSGDDDGDEEMTTDDEPAAPKTRLDPPPLNTPSQTGDNSLRLLFKTIVFSTLCVNC